MGRGAKAKCSLTEEAKKAIGHLHKVNWYRVVLDEAQHIKDLMSGSTLRRYLRQRQRGLWQGLSNQTA